MSGGKRLVISIAAGLSPIALIAGVIFTPFAAAKVVIALGSASVCYGLGRLVYEALE